MTYFEVMQALEIENSVDFIKRISLKILNYYAPGVEVSNFDEANISCFIRKWLERDADEKRCRELGIISKD